MEQSHFMVTRFNYFEWKDEMVIQLRLKFLYRVTMETKTEPNSAVEKSKYFNRMDEAFRMICLSISRDILFHVGSITMSNEFWPILGSQNLITMSICPIKILISPFPMLCSDKKLDSCSLSNQRFLYGQML